MALIVPSQHRTDDTYVIVGAGAFGASVATHLIHKYPEADIVLINRGPFPHEAGASWDWNKVVRADYTNIMYMELALEAMQAWRHDPLYNTYYHESGLVWADPTDRPKTILENYKKLNATEQYRMSNPGEVKALWDGVYSETNYTGVSDILINESSGWVEATKALRQVIQVALDTGVKYVAADIQEVVFGKDGAATGVRTATGDVHSANHAILATGAYTPKLLMDSAPENKDIHAGHRMVAAGICEGSVVLNDEDAKYFRKGPIYVNEVEDIIGGVVPPNPENQLKFYRDQSFANTMFHETAGQNVSVPPLQSDYDQWNLSPGMKVEIARTVEGNYGGKSKDWDITNHRICWIKSSVNIRIPKNLYIATGGSFHSWKSLPTIGKYVIQLMEGTLDPKLAKTWAWDRSNNGSAHEGLVPTREMKDV